MPLWEIDGKKICCFAGMGKIVPIHTQKSNSFAHFIAVFREEFTTFFVAYFGNYFFRLFLFLFFSSIYSISHIIIITVESSNHLSLSLIYVYNIPKKLLKMRGGWIPINFIVSIDSLVNSSTNAMLKVIRNKSICWNPITKPTEMTLKKKHRIVTLDSE